MLLGGVIRQPEVSVPSHQPSTEEPYQEVRRKCQSIHQNPTLLPLPVGELGLSILDPPPGGQGQAGRGSAFGNESRFPVCFLSGALGCADACCTRTPADCVLSFLPVFFFFLSSSLLFFLWGLFAFLSSVNRGEAEPWGKFPVSFGKMCGKGEVRVRARPGYPAWLPGALAWVPQRLRSHLERQSGKGVTSLLR